MALALAEKEAPERVEAALADSIANRPEHPALRELRENSNYLTPQAGMFTTDTRTALTIVVRKILLNWLVIVPALTLVAMASELLASFGALLSPDVTPWFYAVGAIFLALATLYAYSQLPGSLGMDPNRKTIAVVGVGFVLLWALLLPLAYAPYSQDNNLDPPFPIWSELFDSKNWFGNSPLAPVLWSASAAFGSLVAVEARWCWKTPLIVLTNVLIAALIALLSIQILALGVYLFARIEPTYRLDLLVTCGPPLVVITALVATTLFVGLRKVAIGGAHDREWLARLSALKVSRDCCGWCSPRFACWCRKRCSTARACWSSWSAASSPRSPDRSRC